jgi:hypothetical protein
MSGYGSLAAACAGRLERFAELRHHHEHDVEADLAERPCDQAEEIDRLGDRIARHMPGDRRIAELQFTRVFAPHIEALVAERGERDHNYSQQATSVATVHRHLLVLWMQESVISRCHLASAPAESNVAAAFANQHRQRLVQHRSQHGTGILSQRHSRLRLPCECCCSP